MNMKHVLYANSTASARFTLQRLELFLRGQMTLAELEGLSNKDLYAMAQYGYDRFQQGRLSDALKIFEGLTVLNPKDAYFHASLGAVYQRLGQLQEAIAAYTVALFLDPNNLSARLNRGEILLQQGKIPFAVEDLIQVTKQDPNDEFPQSIRARALLGVIHSALKQAEEGGKPLDSPAK